MPFLIDTSVAVCLRDGDAEVRAQIATLDEIPTISVVTLVELEGGVYAKPQWTEQRRMAVDVIREEFEVVDFDQSMATIYGQITAATVFSRRKVVDRMIAATALAHDLTLITGNGADFRDVPGLRLLVWDLPSPDL